MHSRHILLLALGAAAVQAFKDTSPFVFVSTSDFPSSSTHLKTATSLLHDVWGRVKTCPSDFYIIASQPGVHASDFSDRKAAPRLREKVKGADKSIRSNLTVSEVVGILDPSSIRDGLKEECGAQIIEIDGSSGSYSTKIEKGPRVLDVTFPTLPLTKHRAQQLIDNDAFLADIIDQLPSSNFSLVYVTSPREYMKEGKSNSGFYDAINDGVQEPFHMELKRDYAGYSRQDDSYNNKSLFEKYQFLSPGIFMGFLAGFFFLGILYVGMSALLSLEVPYAAFEKDTAPSSQKKQQ